MKKSFLIYIIAGEPSGDFIGSRLISNLKINDPSIKITGIGGSLMEKEGLKSLFDIKTISIMGLFEIIPRIFKIIKFVKLTIADIILKQPDLLITIDSPGFNLKVAKLVKKKLGKKIKILHYVAPSVWAYKPKRAKKFAKIYDYLLCLLPFEPPYFKKEGLKTYFVGHPIVESNIVKVLKNINNKSNKLTDNFFSSKQSELPKEKSSILLLPGSRSKEVGALLPIFLKAASLIKNQYPELDIVIITIPEVEDLVKKLCLDYKVAIVTDELNKYEYFLDANIALAASGTITLELALANVKTIVAYKLNILTSILFIFLIKIKYVSLINIMSNKVIYPEILGPCCTSKKLSNAALDFIKTDLDSRVIYDILYSLGYNNFTPSKKAATLILDILKKI